jgi:hypothetical protein
MEAQEKFLRFAGTTQEAFDFVERMGDATRGVDLPKVMSDFIFAIEVQLQREGFLDENFNVVGEGEERRTELALAMIEEGRLIDTDGSVVLIEVSRELYEEFKGEEE